MNKLFGTCQKRAEEMMITLSWEALKDCKPMIEELFNIVKEIHGKLSRRSMRYLLVAILQTIIVRSMLLINFFIQ